jgi:hypothetical protein
MPWRPASADTAAMATGPSPMPPHSFGMWGSHSSHSLARSRRVTMASMNARRSPPASLTLAWAGSTSLSMNSRTRERTSSISGGKLKSIAMVGC